jgi:hypothetical protein
MMRIVGLLLLPALLSIPCQPQAAAPATVALRDAQFTRQVKNDIVADISRGFETSPGEPDGRTIALSSWTSRIRLSPEGPAAIEVDGDPDDYNNGATGNGDIWIFRIVGNHASLVFNGGGFNLSVLPKTSHKGLRDIKTAWNMSCCDGGIEVYRFDGVRYRPAYCYSYQDTDSNRMKFGRHKRCADPN